MADQIKVNEAAWKALPQEHQDAINEIVTQSYGNVSIVADAATPAPQAGAAFKLPGGLCKLLCEIAAQAGHLACGRLPGPAQSLCNAGVDAGATLCKTKCK
jgi:hypothetical protein